MKDPPYQYKQPAFPTHFPLFPHALPPRPHSAKRQQPLHLVSGSLLPLLPTLDAVMKGGGGMRG